MIRRLSLKDKINFLDYCSNFGQKIFIDCSLQQLNQEFKRIIKTNQICLVDDTSDDIKGLLLIERVDNNCFIKVAYQNGNILDKLLKVLIWYCQKDVILKINDYKVVSVIKQNGFRLIQKTDIDFIYFRKFYRRIQTDGKLQSNNVHS